MKPAWQSKILHLNAAPAMFFLLDSAQTFLASGTLNNICAQKSALAGGIMGLTAILRMWFTKEQLGKEPKDAV